MAPAYKNKTAALVLAAFAGALGLHRFYLRGRADPWGWLHLASLPLTLAISGAAPGQPALFVAAPLVLSGLIGMIEGLALGLTADDKWDDRYNRGREARSRSGRLHALLLVLTAALAAIALIAALARTLDLLFTGGAFG
jgi:hypothetical protein